jgi:hypothetical protein
MLLTACLLLILLIGGLGALPHMGEAIWQDEAATLMFFSSQGVLYPFLHYGMPNNHVGFSALLAAWLALFPGGVDVETLRLLPLFLFLLAIPATAAAGSRLGGPATGVTAALLFAISPVAANFATQLRGYGPSWLFLAMSLFAALPLASRNASWKSRLGYVASTLAAVAILPTNLVFALLIAGSVVVARLASRSGALRDSLPDVSILLIAPPLALLVAYAGIFDALVGMSRVALSPWTGPTLLAEWWRATLWDIRWFAPIAGAGLLLGVWEWRDPEPASKERSGWLVSTALVVGLAAALLASPNPPFPRSLVPFLPIWFCALACLGAYGIRAALLRNRRLPFVAALLASALPFAFVDAPSCRGDPGRGGAYDYNLCHQYFRDAYHPEQVLSAWAGLEAPSLPIVADYEAFYALRVLGSGAPVHSSRDFRWTAARPPLIVAPSREEFAAVRAQIGADAQEYALLADTGYFDVYAPLRPR